MRRRGEALRDRGESKFEAEREALVAKIRENIKVARHAKMEVTGNGMIAGYIHTGAKVGVLVEVGAGKAETVAKDEFKQLVKDITLQIAAGHPHAVSREQVAPEVIAKEREIAMQSDRFKGKPAQAMGKIMQGVLEKFYQLYCLVDQGFVKRNSEVSVKEHVAQTAKQLGDEITIRRFVRFQVGKARNGKIQNGKASARATFFFHGSAAWPSGVTVRALFSARHANCKMA